MKRSLFIGLLLLITISACNLPDPSQTGDSPLATLEAVETTPAILPTATLSPTPEPPPLYFTDEFDTTSTYWEFLQAGGTAIPTTTFQNGTLRIDIPSPDTWLVGVHNANSYSNVFVRAQTSATPAGSIGLICRYSEDGWYEFNISNDGTYSVLLGRWLSQGIVKYAPVINDLSNKLSEAATNEIGLFCEDNFLQLYANGTMIRRVEVTNYGLTEGKVGITASSFTDIPMSAIFEWVQVSQE